MSVKVKIFKIYHIKCSWGSIRLGTDRVKEKELLRQAAEARSEAGRIHADLVRLLEEASRLEEQSMQARVEAERARTEAEEAARVSLEARRIAEEKARMEEEARRQVLFNILSYFVLMLFLYKCKQESIPAGWMSIRTSVATRCQFNEQVWTNAN